IWGAAGIGIAVGAGFYVEAIAGVLLLMISVEIIPLIISKIGPKKLLKKEVKVKIVVKKMESIETTIKNLEKKQYVISNLRVKEFLDDQAHMLEVKMKINRHIYVTD